MFQGVEVTNGSIIAYGLGNFYMNTKIQMEHRGTDIGLFLTVEIDSLGPFAYSVYFVHNQRSLRKLTIAGGKKETELIELFKSISDSLTDPVEYGREWRRDCCRMALGMNDASKNFWILRTTRRAYGVSKMASKAFFRGKKTSKSNTQLRSNSTISELISAAIMGFPTSISDFRNLRKCYKAYDMEVDC